MEQFLQMTVYLVSISRFQLTLSTIDTCKCSFFSICIYRLHYQTGSRSCDGCCITGNHMGGWCTESWWCSPHTAVHFLLDNTSTGTDNFHCACGSTPRGSSSLDNFVHHRNPSSPPSYHTYTFHPLFRSHSFNFVNYQYSKE